MLIIIHLLPVLFMRASITKVLVPKITIRNARLVVRMINKDLWINLPHNSRKEGKDHDFPNKKQQSTQTSLRQKVKHCDLSQKLLHSQLGVTSGEASRRLGQRGDKCDFVKCSCLDIKHAQVTVAAPINVSIITASWPLLTLEMDGFVVHNKYICLSVQGGKACKPWFPTHICYAWFDL